MLRIAGCPIVQPQPISTVSRRAGSHPGEVLRLRLKPPIPFGQYDAALRTAGPEMHCRAQPRGVIQCAGADAKSVSCSRLGLWAAADPRATIRADPPGDRAPAVGFALERARLGPCEVEGGACHNQPHCERATCQTLTFRAVTGVDELRGFPDLIAYRSALAA